MPCTTHVLINEDNKGCIKQGGRSFLNGKRIKRWKGRYREEKERG